MVNKLYLFLIVLLGCLTFSACKKHKQSGESFLPGRLLIGINNDVSIQSVFAFADSEGLSIISVNNYEYNSPYPKDSLAAVSANLLTNKPYINKITVDTLYMGTLYNVSGWAYVKVDSPKNTLMVDCTFMNMDLINQTDWINTMTQLQLTERYNGGNKQVYVKVAPGQEQATINKIKSNPIVVWAEVNNIWSMKL